MSRQPRSGRTTTTINIGYEVRRIIIARGIQRTTGWFNYQYSETVKRRDKLKRRYQRETSRSKRRRLKKKYKKYKKRVKYLDVCRIPDSKGKILGIPLTDRGANSAFRYEYRSKKQRVIYRIRVVETKKEFKKWLETPGVHVIYSGHSRFGRGSCFGDTDLPGDRWEDGTGCTKGSISPDDGLLRLGYDIVGIPIIDIVKHKYHTAPVQGTLRISRKTCHPQVVEYRPMRRLVLDPQLNTRGIRGHSLRRSHEKKWGYWKWDGRTSCIRIACDTSKFDLASFVYRGNPKGPFWGYRKRRKGKWRLYILLHAGWEITYAYPWELGEVNLKSKVFCHFGCSSRTHFRPIIRGTDYKNWKKTGRGRSEDRFAYFTTGPSRSYVTAVWLWALFRYPYLSRGKSWGPSLEWAKRKTRRKLGKLRRLYDASNFRIY